MTFRLLPHEDAGRCGNQCAQAIVADGEITNSTPQEFLSFVSQNLQGNVRAVVFLNSPGAPARPTAGPRLPAAIVSQRASMR